MFKVASILALMLGAVWAVYQFRIFETTSNNIQLTITTEVLPYTDARRILVVHAKPAKYPVSSTPANKVRSLFANSLPGLALGV